MKKTLLVIFIFVLLAGCASSGYKFNEDNISGLRINETSTSQARAILDGEPYQVISNTNGDFLSWIYVSASPFGSTNKMIQLQFVNDKLVKVVQFSGFALSDSERRRLMMSN